MSSSDGSCKILLVLSFGFDAVLCERVLLFRIRLSPSPAGGRGQIN